MGDDAALPLIEKLRQYDEAEAEAILAYLYWRQEKYEEALPILEKCDEVRSNDPGWRWPSKRWIARSAWRA